MLPPHKTPRARRYSPASGRSISGSRRHKRSTLGFSLAEVLIVLLIIGEIATFTIPKVIGGQQSAQRKAIFKESIAAMSEITYLGWTKQELKKTNYAQYFRDRVNHTKWCTNAASQGCWDTGVQGTMGGDSEAGFIMHNGATLQGLDGGLDTGGGAYADMLILDWNGQSGPNIQGDDQIRLIVCYVQNTCPDGVRAGTIGPTVTWFNGGVGTAHQELYAEVFN